MVNKAPHVEEGQSLRTRDNQIRCAGIDGNVAIGHSPEWRAWGARNRKIQHIVPGFNIMNSLVILPKVSVAVADSANRVGIDVDRVRTSVGIFGAKSTRGIPPVIKEGLVVPGLFKGRLSTLLANVPAKERVWVYEWGAAVVLLGIVVVKRHAHVKPLVDRDKDSIDLFISKVRHCHPAFLSPALT